MAFAFVRANKIHLAAAWYTTIVLDAEGDGVTGNNVPLICTISAAPALSWMGLAGLVALLLASGVISLRRQRWFGSN